MIALRFLAAAALGLATYAISAASFPHHKLYLVYAAVVVSAAAAWQLYIAVGTWLVGPEAAKREEILAAVANRYAEMYDLQKILRDEVVKISFHVWEVPLWYRRLFPYTARRFLKQTSGEVIKRHAFTPALKRSACYSIEPLSPGDVVFRKGYGLVGITLSEGYANQVLGADFETNIVQDALKEGQAAWDRQPITTTHHLSHQDALKISARYGQALATVIKSPRTGERIGCLTVEVRKSYPQRIADITELPAALDRLSVLLAPIIDT